jgi:hypothetical protein
LPSGMLAPKRETDTMGRPIVYADQEEHQYQLPDPAEEAAELVKLFENGFSEQEIRKLIGYSEGEKRCLQFLASQGLLASAHVANVLSFRDRVLAEFDKLLDAEIQAAAEADPLSEPEIAVDPEQKEGSAMLERET